MQLGYEITLKSKAKIESLCYESDVGDLGEEGIKFNYQLLKDNGFFKKSHVTVVGTRGYMDTLYAFLIQNKEGAKTLIHSDWIATIKGETTKANPTVVSTNKSFITTTYLIDFKTAKIIDRASLPVCDCGSMGILSIGKGKHLCKDCIDKVTSKHNYSWTPDPYKYIGNQLKADVSNPVWFGLEVEISTSKEDLAVLMSNHKESIYLKEDTSIRGEGYNVEVVSMPHSFSALMGKGSWLTAIDALHTTDSDSNGCHIHIGRSAFVSDRHYSLFYFLLHKMEQTSIKVGGRQLTGYCTMSPTGKVFSKANKKENSGNRGVYLNETNEPTVEARFFKGTTNTTNLKAYVQYLESLIKYTKYHAKSVSSDGWFEYVIKKSTKYKELLTVLGEFDEEEKGFVVVYKEPKLIKKKLRTLAYDDFNKIDIIETKGGDTYKDVQVLSISIREGHLDIQYTRNDGGGTSSKRVTITNIASLLVEE